MTNYDVHIHTNPPSSDPLTIFWELHDDVEGGDNHSTKIAANRSGLIRGATTHEIAGTITTAERQIIEQVVTAATLTDFRPLLLVIPFEKVRGIAVPVPIAGRARATSEEYIIERLPRASFDIIDLARRP